MSKDKTDCTASYRRKRMTNKEAIKILQNDGCCQDCTFGGYPCKLVGCETHQALDLAIKALEERPQGDLISRTWLKEHKFTTQVCNGVEIEDVDVVAVATIDNAPTVEYTFEEAFQKTVCEQRLYCPNKRPQGEWIPVSEKLPDLFEVVLVTDETNKVFEYERRPLDEEGNVCEEWTFLGRNIIAWMPLPEPYKEAEK